MLGSLERVRGRITRKGWKDSPLGGSSGNVRALPGSSLESRRSRAVWSARWSHKPEVDGSNPSSATMLDRPIGARAMQGSSLPWAACSSHADSTSREGFVVQRTSFSLGVRLVSTDEKAACGAHSEPSSILGYSTVGGIPQEKIYNLKVTVW